jgi:hypothetical protein
VPLLNTSVDFATKYTRVSLTWNDTSSRVRRTLAALLADLMRASLSAIFAVMGPNRRLTCSNTRLSAF